MKIRPVFELFHPDRRTDMIKLAVAFRCFVNAPEKLRMNALYVVFMYVQTTIWMLKKFGSEGVDWI